MSHSISIQSSGDVVDYLKSQHTQIKALFGQVVALHGPERQQAFLDLRRLLAVHETAEEEVVHPRAKKHLAGGASVVDARLHEEHEAKQALTRLEKMDLDSPEFEQAFAKLETDVLAHAEAEENEEFAGLEADLDDDELLRLRRAAEAAERMAPTRPHAGVESAAANILVGPFAAMLDHVRDAMTRPGR